MLRKDDAFGPAAFHHSDVFLAKTVKEVHHSRDCLCVGCLTFLCFQELADRGRVNREAGRDFLGVLADVLCDEGEPGDRHVAHVSVRVPGWR